MSGLTRSIILFSSVVCGSGCVFLLVLAWALFTRSDTFAFEDTKKDSAGLACFLAAIAYVVVLMVLYMGCKIPDRILIFIGWNGIKRTIRNGIGALLGRNTFQGDSSETAGVWDDSNEQQAAIATSQHGFNASRYALGTSSGGARRPSPTNGPQTINTGEHVELKPLMEQNHR